MAITAADMTVHVGADTGDLEAGMGRADAAVNKSRAGFGSASLLMGAGAAGIGSAFIGMASSAMDFEGAMNDVSASLLTTDDELEQLGQIALKIGQETIFSATEGAQAIEELGRAGMAIPDIINGGAEAVAALAAATGEDLPNSANAMANAMAIFGLSGDQAAAVADTMTAAMNESSLTLTDFQQGMASAGTIAASVGMSFEQTSAALALFSSRGMSGADAGTALRSMLTHLANPTAEAAAMMDMYGISLQEGIESGDLMGYVAGKLQTQLAGLSEEERLAALNTMFGADAQRVANILFEEGAEGVAEMTEKMKSNGQAQEASRRRMAGLRGAWESFKGSVETLAIVMGASLLPALTWVAEGVGDLVNWFSRLPAPVLGIITAVMGVIGVMLALGSAFAGVMAAGALIPGGFGAVAAAMGAVLAPIGLLIAAAVALYVAWETNFMGIQDVVTSAISAIIGVLGPLMDYLQRVVQTQNVMNAAFGELPGWIQPAAAALGRLVDAFADLYRAFEEGGLRGLLQALPGELAQIGAAFLELAGIILDAIGNIDWGAVGSTILSGVQGAIEWAFSAIAPVVGWVLEVAVPTIAGWLATAAEGTWEALKSAAGWTWDNRGEIPSITLDILDWIVETSRPLWQTVLNKIYGWLGGGTAGDGTGGATGPGGGSAVPRDVPIGTIGLMIQDWLVNTGKDLWSAVKAKVLSWVSGGVSSGGTAAGGALPGAPGGGGIDIGTLTVKIAAWAINAAQDFSVWLTEKLIEGIGQVKIAAGEMAGIADQIFEGLESELGHINWTDVATDLVKDLGDNIRDAVGDMVDIHAEVLTWLSEQIEGVDWNNVGTAVGTFLGDAIVLGIKGIAALVGIAGYLTGQLLLGIVGADWAGIGEAIKTFLMSAFEAAFEFGAGFIQGLFEAVFGDISIGGLIDTFQEIGKGLGIGLWNGIIDQLSGVPGGPEIMDALGMEKIRTDFSKQGGEHAAAYMDQWIKIASGEVLPHPDTQQVPEKPDDWDDDLMGAAGGGGLGQRMSQVITQAGPMIGAAMSALTTGTIQPKVTEWNTAIAAGLAPIAPLFGTEAAKWAAASTTAGLNMISTAFQTQPATWPPPVASAMGAALGAVTTNMGAMGAQTAAGFGRMTSAAQGQMPELRSAVVTNITQAGASMGSQLASMASNVASRFGNMRSTATSESSAMGASVGSNVRSMATDSAARVLGMQMGIAASMSTMRSSAISQAQSMAQGVRSAIATGALQAAQAMSQAMNTIPGIISSVGASAVAAASALGRNVGAALASGLMSMLGAVQAASAALANAASSAMAAALAVSSPSRVALWIAHMVGEGLLQGLHDYLRPVASEAWELATALAEALAPPIEFEPAVAVAGTPAGAVAQGQQSVIYNDYRTYTVAVDDLPEVQRAAEFIDDLQRDREQIYGGI